MSARPVVVTRPGEPGAQLTRDLQAAGLEAVWLPAFTLGPPPDEARVADVLARLGSFQLAIFVSVPAVEATAQRLSASWPAKTAIAVVGAGTQRAALAAIPSAQRATWLVPAKAAAGESGSEALWHVLEHALAGVTRALILRAQQGREWLGEQLAAAGVEVENLAVYTREAVDMQRGAGAALLDATRPPLVVITSSEAVDAFVVQLQSAGNRPLLQAARVLAPHERIVTRARAAGFTDVRLASLDIDTIRQAAFAQ